MTEPRTLVLIPARMAATRLPGKPLLDIGGVPMIVHVLRRAEAANIGRVAVATDTAEIAEAVKSHGGEAVMTRPDHLSGSDRVFEAVSQVDPDRQYDFVLNLQGDLPGMDADLPRQCLAPLQQQGPDIATIAAEMTNASDGRSHCPAPHTHDHRRSADVGQRLVRQPGRLQAGRNDYEYSGHWAILPGDNSPRG